MRVEVPNGCRGIDGPGGRVYRPKKGTRVVEINDNPRFGQLASTALGRTPDACIGFQGADLPSAICASCGFHRFAFTDRPDACPRCGRQGSTGGTNDPDRGT